MRAALLGGAFVFTSTSTARATILLMRKTILYFAGIAFFSSLSAYLVIYVDSSMAEKLLGHAGILPLYATAAIISICLFLSAPTLLSRIGNSFLFFYLSLAQGAALLALSTGSGGITATIALLIHMSTLGALGYTIDLFLEKAMMSEGNTGKIRGVFLSVGNVALVFSPFIAGSVLQVHDLPFLYLLTFFVFCVSTLISLPMLEYFRDPTYTLISRKGIQESLKGPLGMVILCQMILRVFYAWMAILLPLYLHESLGFSWSKIGIILLVSLLPFVLCEAPIGFLADRVSIVRPTVISGFILLAGATMVLSFQAAPGALLVTALLFISRIGASMVEIGTETHFFKQVSAKDEDSIMLFRITQPVGSLLGACLGSIVLLFVPLTGALAFFGAFVFLGIIFAVGIQKSASSTRSRALSCAPGSRC